MFGKILKYLLILDNVGIMNSESVKSQMPDPANESESFNLLLNKPEAHALKSGHCMKEDCGICKALINVGESQSSVVLPVPAKDCRELKNESNISLGICRICHCNPETLPELGPLQSVCNCRGTVALVHMTCLERWLAESDSSSCELCRFQYTVERIPKHGPFESVLVWVNEVADFNQVRKDFFYFLTTLPVMSILTAVALSTSIQLIGRCFCTRNFNSFHCSGIGHFALCLAKIIQYNLKFKLLMDTIWFWLMTPLAAMAGYIFVRATSELIDDNFPTDAPWLMAALMLNSCLTLVAYYGWVMNSVKKHVSSWYRWWRTMDCIIKIQIPERQISSTASDLAETDATESAIELQKDEMANVSQEVPEATATPHSTSPSLTSADRKEENPRKESPRRKTSSKVVGRVQSIQNKETKGKVYSKTKNN